MITPTLDAIQILLSLHREINNECSRNETLPFSSTIGMIKLRHAILFLERGIGISSSQKKRIVTQLGGYSGRGAEAMSEPDLRAWLDKEALFSVSPGEWTQPHLVRFGEKCFKEAARRAWQQAEWHDERANEVEDWQDSVSHTGTASAFNVFANSLEALGQGEGEKT